MALPPTQTKTVLPPIQTTRGLPPSPVLMSPWFGIYPSEQRAGLFVPYTGSIWVTSPILSYMRRYQASLMSQIAQVPVAPETHEWTPEEARAQTEKAIAKIATVNPELAKELLARMQGQEHAEKGFWESLKDVAGDIFAPALSLGGKLLDILSRPARIVPELLADKGDDPWYRDIWQALSGQVDTTWSDVLETWGVDSGPLRAVLGFVLDVATDPLTYVTFGTAGIGRAAVMRGAARLTATKVGAEALEALARRGLYGIVSGTNFEEAALRLYDDLTRIARPFASKVGFGDEEVAAFLAREGVADAARSAVTEMLEAADVVHRMVSITGLRNMPAEIALSTGRKLTRTEVLGILEQARRANLFSRALYPELKAAAGAVGGLRFRFAIPFTDLRYVSPALPISLDTPFGAIRRFITGTSAGKAILSEMDRGLATWDDFLTWVNGGLETLAKKNPELFQRLRGRGFNLGSIFYSASETVGRFTAHLSPHAKMFRGGGLLADLAAHANTLAKGWREELLRQFWTWRSKERTVEPEEFMQRLARLNPERQKDYIRFIETVPTRAELEDLDNWWYELRIRPIEEARDRALGEALAGAEGELGEAFDLTADDLLFDSSFGDPDYEALLGDKADEFETAIERAEQELEQLKRLIASFSDDELETLMMLKEVWEANREEAIRLGVSLGDVTHDFRSATALTPEDARKWTRGTRKDVRYAEWYLPLANPDVARQVRETGVGPWAASHSGDMRMGYGIYMENMPRDVAVTAPEELAKWGPDLTIEKTSKGYRVRGWHGTDSGGIDWDKNSKLGLHIGTKSAAEDRLRAVTYQFNIVFYGETPRVVVDSEDVPLDLLDERLDELEAQGYVRGQDIRVVDHETDPTLKRIEYLEEDGEPEIVDVETVTARELSDRLEELEQEGLQQYQDFNVEETDTTLYDEPGVEDTVRLIPIEAEGNFLNLSSLGTVSDGYQDDILHGTLHQHQFVAALERVVEAGDLSKEEADRIIKAVMEVGGPVGREHLERAGIQGILYTNGVEDRGSISLAILDLSTVRSIEKVDNIRVVPRIRNPLVVDLREVGEKPNLTPLGDASALLEEKFAEIEKALKAELKRVEKEAKPFVEQKVFEAAGLEPLTDEFMAKRDMLFTEWAKKQGYDSVLFHMPDGSMRLMVFDPKAVKVVSEDAPTILPLRGYFPRVLTKEAREALSGQLPPEELKRVIYGEPRIIHNLQRKYIEDPIDVAEEKVRDLLRRQGFQLPSDLPIYERDIVRVADTYAKRLTEGILHEIMGFNARRMVALADYAPGLLGGPMPRPLWTWVATSLPNEEEVLDALELPSDVRRAMDRVERATRSVMRQQYRIAELNDRAIADIRAAMELQLERAGSGLAGRIQAALKRVSEQHWRLVRERQQEIDKLIHGLLPQQKKKLRQLLAKKDKVEQALAEAKLKARKPNTKKVLALEERLRTLTQDIKNMNEEIEITLESIKYARRDLLNLKFGMPLIPPTQETASKKYVKAAQALEKAREKLGEVTAEYVERGLKQEAEAMQKLDAALARLSEAQAEYNHIVAKHHAKLANALPAFVEYRPDLTGFVKLQVKGLEDYAMPAYIALEFQQVLDVKGVSWLRQQWKKFMAVWKEWATLRWPGFHVRNHMGAFFNNIISGVVDVDDYVFAERLRAALHGKKWVGVPVPEELMKKYRLDVVWRDRVPTYDELAARIADMGIGRANARATADVRTMSELAAKELRRKRIPQFVQDLERRRKLPFSRAFGEHWTDLTENIHRVAGFLGGLKATSGDWVGARAFVMMRQGDYLDLTRAEEFIRDLIPFYKWFRTNFPFQLRMLFEDPAKLTALRKVADAAFVAAGMDPREFRAQMPEWMREQFILPVPFPKGEDALHLIMLDLPAADLYTDAKEFMSMFLPVIRPFVEAYVAEKNLFTGRPLEGKMVPLAAYLNLPILRDIIAAMPFAQRGADGQLYLPDKVQHLLTAIPIYSRFKDWLFSEPSRVKYRAAALGSAILGVRIFPFTEDDITRAELEFYYNEVLPQVEMMRSLGIRLPSVEDLSPWTFQMLGLEVPESVMKQ